MAVLLAWISWCEDSLAPDVWKNMVSRAQARCCFPGRTLDAPGVRLFAASTRAGEAEPLSTSEQGWLAVDCASALEPPHLPNSRIAPDFPCAFILIQPSRRSVQIARDIMGQRKLAYARVANGIVVASGEHVLLAHPDVSPRLDPLFLAAFLASQPSGCSETAYANIRQLAPGECIRWQSESPESTIRRLQPEPGLNSIRAPEAITECRRRVLTAVARAVHGARRVGISLSAGMDSSSVAAAMMAQASQTDAPPLAVTYRFESWPDIDEAALVADLTRHLELDWRSFAADDLHPLCGKGSRPVCPDTPVASPFREIKEAAYEEFAKGGVDICITGNFGDHLLADPGDWLANAIHQRRWAAAMRRFAWNLRVRGLREGLWRDSGLRRFARRALKRGICWPGLEFLSRDARQALQVRLDSELNSYSGFPRPLQAFQNLGARAAFDASGEDWFAQRHGMEVRSPFRDPELVRWMLSIPADFSFREGRWKWLIRMAFNELLPTSVAARPKSSDLTPFVDQSTAEDQTNWDALAEEGAEVMGELLDRESAALADADSRWNLRWNLVCVALWRRGHSRLR